MSILRNDSLQVAAPKNTDSRYDNDGAGYANVAAVNSAILSSFRFIGLTVNIQGVEYWYESGITDPDLVIKSLPSSLQNVSDGSGNELLIGGNVAGDITFTGNSSDTNADVIVVPQGTGTFKIAGSHQANIVDDNDVVTKGYFDANSSASPAGANTEVQLNSSGSFGSSSNLTFATNILSVNGSAIGSDNIIFTSPSGSVSILSENISSTIELGVSNSGSTDTANGAFIRLAGTSSDGDAEFFAGSGGDIIFNSGGQPRLTIDSTGRLTTSNYTPLSSNTADVATIGYVNGVASTGISFGAQDTIPQVNSTTDNYDHDPNFTYNSSTGVLTVNDVIISSSSNLLKINNSTSDGSDNGMIELGGGGAMDVTRGGFIRARGNESANPGRITLFAGQNVSDGSIILNTNNTDRLQVGFDGSVRLNNYGSGSITGTPTYSLAVDASGNVVERNLSSGDVTKVGSTFDDQVAVWTGDGTIQGASNLTFSGGRLIVGSGNANQLEFDFSHATIRGFSPEGQTYALTSGDGITSGFELVGFNRDNTALSFHGYSTPGNDTGTNPFIDIRASRSEGGAEILTRPLLRIRNNTTKVAEISASGDWDFQGNNLTNIGNITSGAYTPTFSSGSNISTGAISILNASYTVSADYVTVSLHLTGSPTIGTTLTFFTFTLPSGLNNVETFQEGVGIGTIYDSSDFGSVLCDGLSATTTRVLFSSLSTSSHDIQFQFTYRYQ